MSLILPSSSLKSWARTSPSLVILIIEPSSCPTIIQDVACKLHLESQFASFRQFWNKWWLKLLFAKILPLSLGSSPELIYFKNKFRPGLRAKAQARSTSTGSCMKKASSALMKFFISIFYLVTVIWNNLDLVLWFLKMLLKMLLNYCTKKLKIF